MTLDDLIFRDATLLWCALTHRSWLNENMDGLKGVAPAVATAMGGAGEPKDNERLEFVGDAVVDLAAAHLLYRRFPQLREGDLTSLRAALVKGETLARFAAELGLPPRLRLSHGEERTGARSRVPILAGAFEAVIGALYIDQGFAAAQKFALHFLAPEAERAYAQRLDRDAKSVLQEIVQAAWRVSPGYRIVEARGPEHAKTYIVAVFVDGEEWGRGEGRSKHRAEQAAAQAALRGKRARTLGRPVSRAQGSR